ncbi:MAG: bifunctional hydroxymethylpyrimidine kinase/phosphomethylpyrimidine kinase [Desulfotomaculaceae bacterium]|nr:bifunctional hydroxymethylpyrimidine kinase/phosphomethylpyrimidine kinase [Desulfotomaculaceae bacterium]
MKTRVGLTIAGSDSCGGAGIQADLKTFSALGTYGMSVITAVTAQNTTGVVDVREMDVAIVKNQIDCLFDDIEIDAVKIGMVSSTEIINVIAACLKKYKAVNVVVDPVMVSKSGYYLLRPEAKAALLKLLFPIAAVVTPNIPEAELITNSKIENLEQMKEAARIIYELGPAHVVIKGGHLTEDAIDVLYDGSSFKYLKGSRIDTRNTHGTGCTFSSAITAHLARGYAVTEAVKLAKDYINGAIAHSIELGHGFGPTGHFYELYRKAGMLNA